LKSKPAKDIVNRVMLTRGKQLRLVPWLLAAALIAVQALAFAHELQHDLKQHDDASCVLHLHTKHAGHPSPTLTLPAAAVPHAIVAPAVSVHIDAAPALGYRTRAPPFSFLRSL
jgi:hypothetical protein